jgi:hypothetical protein
MRSVNWNNITASSDGGFTPLPAGPYVARLVELNDNESREYVEAVFDIAEGEHANYYSDDWGKSHPYAHHFFMSYKDSALGMLMGKLHRIYLCNPQRLHATFDQEGKFLMVDEFEAENYSALVGCRFGAVVRRRLYTAGPNSKTPGADKTAVEIATYLTPDEFRDGSWSKNLLKDRDQRDKAAQQPEQQQAAHVPPTYSPDQTPDLYDEDVPF